MLFRYYYEFLGIAFFEKKNIYEEKKFKGKENLVQLDTFSLQIYSKPVSRFLQILHEYLQFIGLF